MHYVMPLRPNNIMLPARLKELAFGSSCFGRVIMNVGRIYPRLSFII